MADYHIKDIREPSDIKTVAALAASVWTEHYTPLIGAEQVAYMLDNFQSEQAITKQLTEGYHYSAAFVGGEPGGYCATRYDVGESRVFLSKLYVARIYRQQGLAREMLRHHLQALCGLPVHAVWLTVNKHNEASIAAYRRMGFAIRDSVVTDIGGGYVMDDYIMERIQ